MRLLLLLAGITALMAAGCVSSSPLLANTDEYVVRAPVEVVLDSLIAVLETEGYRVKDSGDARIIRTSYRRETRGWNILDLWRFGITRSYIEGTVSADNSDATRLSLTVVFETKRYIWSAWREAPVPPHRHPDVHVDAVKRQLGLI